MRGGTGPLCGAFFAPKPFFLSLFEHGKKGEQIKNRYIFHIKACIPCVSLRAATHALIDHRLPANPEIITENVFSPPPHHQMFLSSILYSPFCSAPSPKAMPPAVPQSALSTGRCWSTERPIFHLPAPYKLLHCLQICGRIYSSTGN